MGTPERGLLVEEPLTLDERVDLARRCARDMELPFPMLVDGMDDGVEEAYAAWPERLYLVDVDGTVIYRGEKGPMGFDPDGFGQVLAEVERFYAR